MADPAAPPADPTPPADPPKDPPPDPPKDPPTGLLDLADPPDPADPPADPPPADPADPPKPTATDPIAGAEGTFVYKEKPDFLREAYWDKETGQVNVEALAKSEQHLRAQVSKGVGDVPADAGSYKVEIEEELQNVAFRPLTPGSEEQDPLAAHMFKVFHDHNVTDEQAQGILNGYLRGAKDKVGSIPTVEEEMTKLGAQGKGLVNGMARRVDQWMDLGAIDDNDKLDIEVMCSTASGLRAMHKILNFYGEPKMADMAHVEIAGGESADDLRAEMAEILKLADAGDQTAAKKYERLMEKYNNLYGTEPASGPAKRLSA